MNEFDKCYFCRKYDSFDGCTDDFCCRATREYYEPSKERIIEKAKENGISVSDVIALINLE